MWQYQVIPKIYSNDTNEDFMIYSSGKAKSIQVSKKPLKFSPFILYTCATNEIEVAMAKNKKVALLSRQVLDSGFFN